MLNPTRISVPFVLLAAGLLGACAMQTYEARPIDAARTVAEHQDRSLHSDTLRTFMLAQGYPDNGFPIKAWGLHELTLAAFLFNPGLEVARARWRATQAAELTAAQKPNPSLSVNTEHHSKTEGGVSPWTLGFALDFPIETGGKREARIARAVSLSEAARHEIGQVAWTLRSQLRIRLLEYHSSRQQASLLEREVGLRAGIVDMLEKRLAVGMISDIDLNTVRLNLQKARQSLAAEQGRQAALRAQVADAAGLPAQALEQVQLAMLAPPSLPLPEPALQRAALLNRLDIRAALARYAAGEAKLRLEIAKQRPDISLAPGYAFDQNDNRWSLGISMLLALLNKNEGPIAEARALREVEARQFEELQVRVVGELDQARLLYQSTLDESAKAQRLLDAQREREAQTERQFETGHIDRLELTGMQLETLVAEQGLLAARLRSLRALGLLEDAMQKPLDGTPATNAPELKDETA